jgi:hypothetical protein
VPKALAVDVVLGSLSTVTRYEGGFDAADAEVCAMTRLKAASARQSGRMMISSCGNGGHACAGLFSAAMRAATVAVFFAELPYRARACCVGQRRARWAMDANLDGESSTNRLF